jgi:hypothetical protein
MAPPTATLLSSTNLSYWQNDKPCFLTTHALNLTHTSSKWQQAADLGGATDRTDSSYPAIRARDLHCASYTAPSTGSTVYYFVCNVTGAFAIDTVAVLGHNFNAISATQVDFIVSTDNLFDTGTNSYTVASWSSPSAVRLAATSLYHTGSAPYSYSGATWVALKVTCGSSQIPRMCEFWFGPRAQMPYKPNIEWDPDGPLHADATRLRTDSGHVSTYVRSYGQRKVNAEWSLPNTSANQTLISGLWTRTQNWTRPFLFWENPYSDERNCNMMVSPGMDHTWMLSGPSERTFNLEMHELPPYEANGV